jgi:hypothetical protein
MATLTYPYTAANGDTPDATDYNGNFTAIKTLLETTKLDTANLSTPYSLLALSFTSPAALVGATTYVARYKVPASTTLIPVSVSFSFTTATAGVPTPTFQFTDDGANVLTSALTASLPATTYESTGFSITSIAAASDLVFTMTGTAATTATDLFAVVTFKVLIRA